MPSEEEMKNLQRLSNNYQSDAQNDLVGHVQSTQTIRMESPQADPKYVDITTRFAKKYSLYRATRADGNSGWRALAYGYFEALLRAQDPLRIHSEIARIISLNNLFRDVDIDQWVLQDFVQETLDLLERTRVDMPCLDDGAMLLASFNDAGITQSIIRHFRLITSVWMRTYPAPYQLSLLDSTIDEYCKTKFESYAVELEQLGLQVLIDALIKPAGINVEIIYLDRVASDKDEVDSCYWSGEDNGHPMKWTIRLLYRPGHYSILYKNGDLPHDLHVGRMSYAPSLARTNLLDTHKELYIPNVGTSIYDQDEKYGDTLLTTTSKRDYDTVVQTSLENEANVNAFVAYRDRWTALQATTESDILDVILKLLRTVDIYAAPEYEVHTKLESHFKRVVDLIETVLGHGESHKLCPRVAITLDDTLLRLELWKEELGLNEEEEFKTTFDMIISNHEELGNTLVEALIILLRRILIVLEWQAGYIVASQSNNDELSVPSNELFEDISEALENLIDLSEIIRSRAEKRVLSQRIASTSVQGANRPRPGSPNGELE